MLAGVGLALVAGACGIDPGGPESLPGGVVAPAVAPSPRDAPGTGADAGARPVRIFLVAGSRLIDVPRTTPAPDLVGTLQVLLEGPTAEEISAGTRSAIAPGTRLRSARVEVGTAVIDLSRSFVDVGGEEQILAVAQLVLTATTVPGVERVRLALEGEALEVPRADGTLAPGPLTGADYASLRLERAPR
ncbi:MAG: GerMN domain-containing protein [Acidimicrobiia bacterium]